MPASFVNEIAELTGEHVVLVACTLPLLVPALSP